MPCKALTGAQAHVHASLPFPAAKAKRQCVIRAATLHTDIEKHGAKGSVRLKPIELPAKPGHGSVYLFGVEHSICQAEPADFILEHKPAAVVFESSFSAAGGNGAIVDCSDSSSHDGGALITSACSTAARLQRSPPAVFDHVWQQLKERCDIELLAHMAAFITGTKVIHADRPKGDTFRRLLQHALPLDLDLAIAAQSCINYADQLGVPCGHDDLSASPIVHRIFTTERDNIIAQELQRASQHQPDCIVGIVGSGHIPGILHCWDASMEIAADSTDLASSEVVTSAAENQLAQHGVVPLTDETQHAQHEGATLQGVKRALLERFIELSCNAAVCAELQLQLSPLPAEALWAYEHVQQLYGGSTRMMLAALPHEHLSKVVSGWRCDMWDVLEPVRAVRPAFGGSAVNEELLLDLNQLQIELA